jgi:hypothetical protein
MTYMRVRFGRLSGIILIATAILSAHSRSIVAQELERQTSATDHSQDASSLSQLSSEEKPTSATNDLVGAALPDAPMPAGQTQDQSQRRTTVSGQKLNQLPMLPPRRTMIPLTAEDKFQIYIHKTFGPPAVILPALGAGYQMINPPNNYPRDWKDGAGAFGRNYGYRLADHTSRNTAQFMTGLLLHEDPRYQRSTSTNPFGRTVHALAYTVVDKTDSGKNTIAASNFASAAAGGFVGMGILPDGYNDLTHAEQHMASEFLQLGIGNVITEFQPEWGPWAQKIHLPKILPAWWVPEHP